MGRDDLKGSDLRHEGAAIIRKMVSDDHELRIGILSVEKRQIVRD